MTLYRQLLATMLILFGLLFAATYWVQFNSTRTYLAQQQETTVINTATSLGLALTPYLENGDKVGAESVIQAIFDGDIIAWSVWTCWLPRMSLSRKIPTIFRGAAVVH